MLPKALHSGRSYKVSSKPLFPSRQVSRGSAGEYQADERAGVTRLSWRLSGRDTRQMSGQVSRGSAGEYQADERAVVAQLRWRVSGR